MDAFEREERDLDKLLEQGKITGQEHTERLNDLEQDHQEAERESAEDAYDDEMERW